jgi:hypothetical protein
LQEYGWSLFIGIPFFLGFGSVLLHGQNRIISYREAMAVMFASIILFNISVFVLAFEGIICLTMAFPLLLLIGWMGATVGFAIHQSSRQVAASAFSLPLLLILLMGGLEHQASETPPLTSVHTEVVINASKQAIWDELVAFSEIEAPTEWLFYTGIAYPTHAEINGVGVGAVRRCNFTTGTFVEPITVWDEPNLLAFSVLDQPPPMLEWSIYQDLSIEHLNGYFKSERGEFRLESLPDGSVKLTGTTWYRHDIWPTFYWGIYSNYILHTIHFRVLNHIKIKAESA